jgi:hypothetical protein
MDATRFDTLIRSLTDGSSRRAALGVGLGGVLAALGLGESEAKKKRRRKKKCKRTCGPCQRCKKGKCRPKPAGIPCGDGGECLANGSCALSCTMDDECDRLPSGCGCSPASAEGVSHCYGHVNSCDEIPKKCESTAECPLGRVCQPTGCVGGGNRCWPLCAV